MNGIEKIVLCLENCEIITIDGKYIGEFFIGDIQTEIRRTACNSIEKMMIAYKVVIEINREANTMKACDIFYNQDQPYIFDRICRYNDITSITIYYDEYQDGVFKPTGNSEIYYVGWTGDDEYKNEGQHSNITSQGDLHIGIMENYDEADYFDTYDTIEEEKDDTDFRWSMYS